MTTTNLVNSSNQRAFVLQTYDKVKQGSPNNAKFSFGRASRFPTIKRNCPVGSYDNSGALSNRATSLGYGVKKAFDPPTHSPSPDHYKSKSNFDLTPEDFSPGRRVKPSVAFGTGREDYVKTVYNTGKMYGDPIVPGPGEYTDKTMLIGVNARKTTLKERKFYLDDDEMARKLAIPGAGTYED